MGDFEQDPDEINKIFNDAKRLDATPSFDYDEMIESMYIPGKDDDASAGDYDHEMDDFDDDDFVVSDNHRIKEQKKKKNSKKKSLQKEDDAERKKRKEEKRRKRK